ncbi:MAG: hypothetical protein NWE92_06855 [Candidatus Bathyarchaeota archaeon]|nr:hypothetical protein [Candidatus Bathyarchaeota archaeon]
MLKRRLSLLFIVALIVMLAIPTYFSSVSSSTGNIRINSTTTSPTGQTVMAGGNINLYFGSVTWSYEAFYIFISQNHDNQYSTSDIVCTPSILASDLANTTKVSVYNFNNQTWLVGSNWVNGTLPRTIALGNYYIKAVDQFYTVAVTDTYITVNSQYYPAVLNISPDSGPGGVNVTFSGYNYPNSTDLSIFYYDPDFDRWNFLTNVTSDESGQISVPFEVPDLKKSVGTSGVESFNSLSYRVTDIYGNTVYSTGFYNQYLRGLNQVGSDAEISPFYGNGTSIYTTTFMVGDNLPISGRWFHPGVIYIRFDGVNVVDTVTSDEWNNAQIIGTTAANSNGSFSITVQIPNAVAGLHYIAIEDSQTRITVQIFVFNATLSLSPSSGTGGATVQFTGERYPPSSTVTLSCEDPDYYTWSPWETTTSDASGRINFTVEIPDLKKACYNDEYSNYSSPICFRTEVNNVPCSYADYTQNWRGLNQVAGRTAYALFGNGTNLSYDVNVTPGSSMFISGKWFHPGVVYIRFDGIYVVDTVTSDEWRNAQIIGTTTANAYGSFATNVTIPTASGGNHYVEVEDSETRITVKITVDGPVINKPTSTSTSSSSSNTPAPTAAPTSNPNLPTPAIDVSCKGTTTLNGLKVNINGDLKLSGQPLSNTSVLLSYSITGGSSWQSLTLVKTDASGNFAAVWTPDVTGNYLIKAAVDASSTYGAASKTVTLVLSPDAESNVFSVNSNSTISQLAFNSTSNELAFTASGQSGTHGYVEVYVPKTLISDISNLRAFVDGAEVSFSSQDQGDAWFITLSYSHSEHRITMELGVRPQTIEPLTGNWFKDNIVLIAIIGLVLVIVAGVVVAYKRNNKSQK